MLIREGVRERVYTCVPCEHVHAAVGDVSTCCIFLCVFNWSVARVHRVGRRAIGGPPSWGAAAAACSIEACLTHCSRLRTCQQNQRKLIDA